MREIQLRSLGESPKGNRVPSSSAALCHRLMFNCIIYVSVHASDMEWRETNMIKSLGSGQNVHVVNGFILILDMTE